MICSEASRNFLANVQLGPHRHHTTSLKSEVGSASQKSCAASARATTLKILRRKPKKIIAPQTQV